MIGYVARDLGGDLYLHQEEPTKEIDGWYSQDFFQITDDMFPEFKDITYEEGPVKVEFNIKKV